MPEASHRQDLPAHRISFVDAPHRLSPSPPGTPLPRPIVNPDREGRAEPRCLRRPAKNDLYMIRSRNVSK
jgi:hypothetical protein